MAGSSDIDALGDLTRVSGQINYLAQRPIAFGLPPLGPRNGVPNPIDWLSGANAIWKLHEDWPEHSLRVAERSLEDIIAAGAAIDGVLRRIPNQELFSALVSNYVEASEGFQQTLFDVEGRFLADVGIPGVDLWETPGPSAPMQAYKRLLTDVRFIETSSNGIYKVQRCDGLPPVVLPDYGRFIDNVKVCLSSQPKDRNLSSCLSKAANSQNAFDVAALSRQLLVFLSELSRETILADYIGAGRLTVCLDARWITDDYLVPRQDSNYHGGFCYYCDYDHAHSFNAAYDGQKLKKTEYYQRQALFIRASTPSPDPAHCSEQMPSSENLPEIAAPLRSGRTETGPLTSQDLSRKQNEAVRAQVPEFQAAIHAQMAKAVLFATHSCRPDVWTALTIYWRPMLSSGSLCS